jgi:putative NADPH-quinone reductase
MTHILIIDAHPDPDPGRFVHALADAYAQGAQDEDVRRLKLSEMDIPVLHRPDEWLRDKPPAQIAEAQEAPGPSTW